LLYEYRRYSIVPGKPAALAQRFENVTVPLWERHGIKPVGFWEPIVGRTNELHYLLAWNDMAERGVRWNAFQADPEWISKRDQSEASGPLVAYIHNELWNPTSYSQLK
jgi:NIPSNAP